ncbi:MAG: adenine phosphoribosyltransferase [archaeon]
MDIKSKIRTVPDWPKPGIMFRDITTLLKDPDAVKYVINQFYDKYKNKKIDKIVGIESRGFIFGALLADKLNKPFVLARKPKKLPAPSTIVEYELEYGKDALAIHNDAISKNDNVLIIDDLIATAGTSKAVAQIVEKLKGKVFGFGFVIELPDLKGREKLKGYDILSLVNFEGD